MTVNMRANNVVKQRWNKQKLSTKLSRSALECPSNPLKARTGIIGFDEMTGGGLPRGRTTLLVGGPGSGKTLFGLRFLVQGARDCGEPGSSSIAEHKAQSASCRSSA